MTQPANDLVIPGSPLSGAGLVTNLQDIIDGIASSHKGGGRPNYVKAGMMWVEDVNSVTWKINLFDGAQDVPLATIDPSNNTLTYATQAEAEAGAITTAPMNPLRVSQAISAQTLGIPTGSVIAIATDDVPVDFLECNGASLDRGVYPELFAVIGVIYGSQSGSTFNIPQLRGEFIRGLDNNQGVDPDRTSRTNRGDGQGGDFIGTRQESEFESHDHDLTTVTQAQGIDDGLRRRTNVGEQFVSSTYLSEEGGSEETRPRNVYMMYIIRV